MVKTKGLICENDFILFFRAFEAGRYENEQSTAPAYGRIKTGMNIVMPEKRNFLFPEVPVSALYFHFTPYPILREMLRFCYILFIKDFTRSSRFKNHDA